jgi:hypothetical protein
MAFDMPMCRLPSEKGGQELQPHASHRHNLSELAFEFELDESASQRDQDTSSMNSGLSDSVASAASTRQTSKAANTERLAKAWLEDEDFRCSREDLATARSSWSEQVAFFSGEVHCSESCRRVDNLSVGFDAREWHFKHVIL